MPTSSYFISSFAQNNSSVFLEVPHGGSLVPEFMKSHVKNFSNIMRDKDWFTQEVYGCLQNSVKGYIQWNIARVLVDPNRNIQESFTNLKRDGVLKKCSMFSQEVWNSLPSDHAVNTFIDEEVRPYYECMKEYISDPEITTVVFGHSMPEEHTVSSTAQDIKNREEVNNSHRPLFSLCNGNNHFSGISEKTLQRIKEYVSQNLSAFILTDVVYNPDNPVAQNYPYSGEVSINRFPQKTYGENTKAVLIEFNRGLGKHDENILVLQNIMKAIIDILDQRVF